MDADPLDVLIVGTGFAGVHQLRRLRDLGFSVAAVDAGEELGGIWYWNAYPGARVDSHVPIYEFSDEAVWKDWYWDERFPGREALRRYFAHVDDVWDISRDVRFGTRIEKLWWDEPTRTWTATTTGCESFRTRYVVLCTGFASKPHVPAIPGLTSFAGPCHHTARWPQEGIDLTGRRVGVVGTGASGVQVIQEAAAVAAELTVFQRTPIIALPMQQRPLGRDEQDEAKAHYPAIFRKRTATNSGFDLESAGESALAVSERERTATYERLWDTGGLALWVAGYRDAFTDVAANRTVYDFWLDRVRSKIGDPALADLVAPVEPPHPFGIKRPSLEQGYYEALGQPNVAVVDLRATPFEGVEPGGIRTADRLHPLDVIVLATGFDAVTGGITSIDIRGTTGETLAQRWSTGVRSHLGVTTSGFPNLLYLYGPQSPSGFCNGPTCAEVQGDWLVDLLVHLRERGVERIETTPAAEARWREVIEAVARVTLFPQADSWYMGANIPGKPRELLNFPSLQIYRQACDDDAADGYAGFTFDGGR